jgi:hypothetical protein
MRAITTIGLDIAKSVFQVHGIDAEGNVLIRRQLKRRYVLAFFEKLQPCLVGIEACATLNPRREHQRDRAPGLHARSKQPSPYVRSRPSGADHHIPWRCGSDRTATIIEAQAKTGGTVERAKARSSASRTYTRTVTRDKTGGWSSNGLSTEVVMPCPAAAQMAPTQTRTAPMPPAKCCNSFLRSCRGRGTRKIASFFRITLR